MNIGTKTIIVALGCALLPHGAFGQTQGASPLFIERLAPPRPAEVPGQSETGLDDDLQSLREKRRQREKKNLPPPPSWQERLAKKLQAETDQPLDRTFMLEISGIMGQALTHAPTRDYTSNLTSHFHLYWRPFQTSPVTHGGIWTGLRVAPFSGTGFYDDTPGRYGLTYVGPIVAWGVLRPKQDESKGASHGGESSRRGWMISFGIAGLSRLGESEESRPASAANDLTSSQGMILDGSGLWMEIRYLTSMFGGLGLNYVVGGQSGRYRQFLYAGLGFAGWN